MWPTVLHTDTNSLPKATGKQHQVQLYFTLVKHLFRCLHLSQKLPFLLYLSCKTGWVFQCVDQQCVVYQLTVWAAQQKGAVTLWAPAAPIPPSGSTRIPAMAPKASPVPRPHLIVSHRRINWSTAGVDVTLEVSGFLSDTHLVVKVNVWLPPEERRQHLGKMTTGIQRGSSQYLLVTSAELIFLLLPIAWKSIIVVRRRKYFFLFLSMWITLPAGKSCPAHGVQWCGKPATVHCTRRKMCGSTGTWERA